MKNKTLLSILLAVVMVVTMLPMMAFAAPRTVTAASTASITVEQAVPNDELSAYKVIDITYDAATNTLAYAWNSDFADYFAGSTSFNATAITVENFAKLADDSQELKDLLANLPQYIAARNIAPVKTETVAADGTATFADLAMGEYFIRPTSSTSVYQLMFQKLEPTVDGGVYVIDDNTFTAKKTEVTVTKTADKTSVTKNEKVTYTVSVDIPTYSDNATDKTFSVSDLMPDGLTLDPASITLTVDGVTVPASAYDITTTATAEYTYKITVSNDQYDAYWAANGGKKLVISYKATLNDDDTTEVNTVETNTVKFDYSFYPFVTDSHNHKEASVDVTTFEIKIDKYAKGDSNHKLADAHFDLYRTATRDEIDAGKAVKIPHTDIDGILLEADKVTDVNGVAEFKKYEANADKYDYYLVETKAPSGYNLLTEAIKVNFTDAEVEATAGIYTVEVENSDGFTLPQTGGIGTAIFTAVGIAIMGVAVVMLIVTKKKKSNSAN